MADAREKWKQAEREAVAAREAARAADRREAQAYREMQREARAVPLDQYETCRIEDLREAVADAARDHGSDCADLGRIPPDPSEAWTRFRSLLSILARRASP
jgi:hypothetical protein